MFDPHTLTKVATWALTPLTVSLALVLAGTLLAARRRRSCAGTVLALCGVTLVVGGSLPVVATSLARTLEQRYPPRPIAACARADVIVVLGGVVQVPAAGSASPRPMDGSGRVWHAARLHRAGCAPAIFVAAGGIPRPGPVTEAASIRDMLVELGVPASAIGLEGISRNTRQNAQEAAAVLLPAGSRRILLVTSAWHMRRAEREFQRAGFDVTPAPADYRSHPSEVPGIRKWLPDPEALQLTHLVVKEWLGWYALKA